MKSNDSKVETVVGILEFSKAFDTVPHDKLLHKLDCYGIRGHTLGWIKNFLTTRHMKVIVEGEASTEATVDSGVPQGTVLGPLLFLCHINDLPDRVSSKVRLFADDCLLYRDIHSPEDHQALQDDLNSLQEWAVDWGMKFNADKCYILPINQKTSRYYQLNKTILKHVETNPYLGLQFSKDLTWTAHITNTVKKASSTLGFLRRNLSRCPQECRKTAYIALVRSTLEYGSMIWDPYLVKDVQLLEQVQRRAARFITGDYKSRTPGSMTKMLEDLNIPTLKSRREDNRLTFLYKISKGLIPAIPKDQYLKPIVNKRKIKAKTFDNFVTTNFVTRRQTLNENSYTVPDAISEQYKNSFFPRTIPEWNELEVSASTVEDFKRQMQARH